jgi:flavin reductase (DIM6/NTAB) family NADH-FMN oxidoreductase RutF
MNEDAKKTALRMIPYGLYVLTGEHQGTTAAATINWATQVAFKPPLVAIGVKADSGAHAIIKESKRFALNILGKGQESMAYNFFKSHDREGNSIGGEVLEASPAGVPVLKNTPAWIECNLVDTVERGDHSVFVGEVTEAWAQQAPEGRPDDATLWLKDLGEKVFYGG